MGKKGKMPAALKAYWAKKRGETTGGGGGGGSKKKGGGGSKKKGGGGGRGVRSTLRGYVQKDALFGFAGAAVGLTASNQLAPRIGTKMGGFWASDKGQLVVKIGLGIGGGMVLAKANSAFAKGFTTGAVAEPLGGLIRSVTARNKAATTPGGVQGMAGLADADYEGVEGLGDAYEGVEGLAQFDYANGDE